MKNLTCICLTAAALSLTACASQNLITGETTMQPVAAHQSPAVLPKPDQVLIRDFTVPPEVVTVDYSPSALLHNRLPLLNQLTERGVDQSAPQAVARQVQASFSKAALTELQNEQIPAEADRGRPVAGRSLIVQGEFTGVDEGNKTRRVAVGFGRGASDVQAHVTVLLTNAEGAEPVVVSDFILNSESGKKPGAAVGAGAGRPAAGAAGGTLGDQGSSVEADAVRMGESLAGHIRELMIAQGWLGESQPGTR